MFLTALLYDCIRTRCIYGETTDTGVAPTAMLTELSGRQTVRIAGEILTNKVFSFVGRARPRLARALGVLPLIRLNIPRSSQPAGRQDSKNTQVTHSERLQVPQQTEKAAHECRFRNDLSLRCWTILLDQPLRQVRPAPTYGVGVSGATAGRRSPLKVCCE